MSKAGTATPGSGTPSRMKVRYEYPAEGLLNYSQLMDWLKCRYRWDLGKNRHISSRRLARSMDMGSAVHAGMKAGFLQFSKTKKITPAAVTLINRKATTAAMEWLATAVADRGGEALLSAEQQEEYQDIKDNVAGIVVKALKDIRLERWRILQFGITKTPLIDFSLTFPLESLSGWDGFHFTPDLVAEDLENGGNWVLDYKVRKQFTPLDAEDVNLQFVCYQKGLQEKGIQTVGSIMYQILSKQPQQPSLNKNGSMSLARIATTWEVYQEALIKNNLDPNDYLEMKQKLDVQFFREDRVYRNQVEIGNTWHEVIRPAMFAMSREKMHVFRTMHYMNCNGCWARQFCLTELKGEDTDFQLQTDYVDLDNPAPKLVLSPDDIVFTP